MLNGQLELTLNPRGSAANRRRRQRLSRAQWWFERMRQVVELAVDRNPLPPPRPEQMVFPGAHRQPLALPANGL